MDFGLSLRETIEYYGLMAKKSLGQNFLLDQNITSKIIRLSLEKQGLKDFSNVNVFEIGSGPGGLTRAILENQPKKLTVIEMDERTMRIMEDLRRCALCPLNVINADALAIDLSALENSPRQIISNLPYNISVPLLVGWLKQMPAFSAMTLMFQKEVAERITAPIKTKNYGRVSVLAQLVCQIDKLFDLPPTCFVPAPKVWSSVLLFRPKNEIPVAPIIEKIEKITAAAFGQRRKMIRQSLKSFTGLEQACMAAGIDMTMRAEDIAPEKYLMLVQNL